ncbi:MULTISPECIES: FkbM family methyltransferase [unclassified Pseudovibrio]|uniref:FkbM family methyltransferase n=1 Tax=unclassified Pseudovibrio TaxID=2627060 RepID=UPI001AD9099F|nr:MULTISPECIES: FkbM family methyltransferase [unclassified Pseudovibrio]
MSAFLMGLAPHKRSGTLARLALRLDKKNLSASRVLYLKEHKGFSNMRRLEEFLRVGLGDEQFARLSEKYFYYCRAQRFQELHFLKQFPFYEKQKGFFVEIGVGDGTHLSNSFLFERALGWSGLLVEPNSDCWEQICSRRDADLDKRAAWSSGGGALRFFCADTSEYSGMLSVVGQGTKPGREIEVPIARTEDILVQHNVPDHIPFISIDTEGTELEVLKGIDFSRRTFDFLCVEHNHNSKQQDALVAFMKLQGYVVTQPELSGADYWFVSGQGRASSVSAKQDGYGAPLLAD